MFNVGDIVWVGDHDFYGYCTFKNSKTGIILPFPDKGNYFDCVYVLVGLERKYVLRYLCLKP